VVVTAPLLLLAISASTIHFFARPHILSWLFTLLWFNQLDSSEADRQVPGWKRLAWLPVLMLLWVNLHGGLLLGFTVSGIYLMAGIVDLSVAAGPEARRAIVGWLRALAVMTGLSFVVSLLNPYTYHLYGHIRAYLSNRFLMDHIDEFASPNFHGVA